MATNVFATLTLPALNGAGAAVDVTTMAGEKTFIVDGVFTGATITVEVSTDGGNEWAPLVSFQSGGTRIEKLCAATHLRASVSGRKAVVPFSATVTVAAPEGEVLNAVIAMPASNGAGAVVDVSTLGLLCTVVLVGYFPGAAITIEASEDGSVWAPITTFQSGGGSWTGEVTGFQMRAVVSGRNSQSPFTDVSASVAGVSPDGGGSGGGGGDRGWYGTGIDGDVTISGGITTLTRDMYYNNLTIEADGILFTANFKVAVADTLTIIEGGLLFNSGVGTAATAPGTLLAAGSGHDFIASEVQSNGGAGESPSWWPLANTPIGSGGNGGDTPSRVGGAGGTPKASLGAGPYTIEQIASGDGVCGGAGGGSGASDANPSVGGDGGAGGGPMVIKARFFVVPDNAIVSQGAAGNAGTGTAGGGGGGQGGPILIITDDAVAPVCDVSGGAGGAAGGSGGDPGTAGDDGIVIAISPVHGPL